MSDIENKQIPLPEKEEGTHKDIEAQIKSDSVEDAKQLFESSKKRLLNVNEWDKICGKASAVFRLTDEQGREVEGTPEVGYHFKINIPAPGTDSGDGFDWVRVEAIEDDTDTDKDTEFLVIRVRPSRNPSTPDKEISHFFSEKATSNFVISREKKVVTAAVLGRNEMANTKSTGVLDMLRNAIVGLTAAAGLSTPQWKSLVNGVLGKE